MFYVLICSLEQFSVLRCQKHDLCFGEHLYYRGYTHAFPFYAAMAYHLDPIFYSYVTLIKIILTDV